MHFTTSASEAPWRVSTSWICFRVWRASALMPPGDDLAGRGVEADLTREEHQISGAHRLGERQVAPRGIRRSQEFRLGGFGADSGGADQQGEREHSEAVATGHDGLPSQIADFGQKLQQRGIDAFRPLLLNPVTGAFDDHFLHAGHGAAHVLDRGGTALARDHRVARADDEQRGLTNRRVLPRRGQRPVAIDVAIPVEPAAKTGASIFARELLDVLFAQPGRQLSARPRADRESRGPRAPSSDSRDRSGCRRKRRTGVCAA